MPKRFLKFSVPVVACLLATAAAGAGGTASASPRVAPTRPAVSVTALPAQVYAPYFETFLPSNIATIAKQSGVKYFTLAFLQASHKYPCTAAWNGLSKDPVSDGMYLGQIKALRKTGGDVIPSFGGYSADHSGTELADSCTSVAAIVAAYKQLIRMYRVSRLDFDIESKSLKNVAGITRRDEAISILEKWAEQKGLPLQVSFTMPATADGLTWTGLRVLKNAIAEGTRVDIVNIMTFDYYNGTTDMGGAAVSAGQALYKQLVALYPAKTSAELYAMEGITMMPGIDDNPNLQEVTTLDDANEVESWAASYHIGLLSIWAIQRDNGGCPGTNGANTCSGISQAPWAFSHELEPFDS